MRFLISVLVCAPIAAQVVSPAADPTRHAPAFDQPADSRGYIVTFQARSFELDDLQNAIRDRQSAAHIERIVADLAARAAADQTGFARAIEPLGGSVRQHFWLINGCSIDAPPGLAPQLAKLAGVAEVFRNEWRAPQHLTAPILDATNASNHNADAVQAQGIDGAGVTVAVIDTGFDANMGATGRPHAVFYVNGDPANPTGGGIGGSRLLLSRQMGAVPPETVGSHGTRVAASAIGERWNASAVADRGHAPAAKLAGYAISDFSNGSAELQTMVAAFQQVVADRVAQGISVANMSYGGSPSPRSPEQVAMDTAARVGDLLITLSGGQRPSPTFPFAIYHGARNVLACGTADTDTHTAPTWTSLGPLPSGAAYPHILANGNGITTPEADNEAISTQSFGTSHSAAQVAGAAALFRSVATAASALETRAALLATTEDVSDRALADEVGYGYLRDDRLVALAQGQGLLQTDVVDTATASRVVALPVTERATYAVVLCFDRQLPQFDGLANLDLRVLQDGLELAASRSMVDPNEKVVFRARTNSPVQIVVERVSLEPFTTSQPFALAAVAAPDAIVPGAVVAFGSGCAGAPGQPIVVENLPRTLFGFGNTSTDQVFGTGPHRVQQVFYDATWPFAATTLTALAFRHDEVAAPTNARQWIELELEFGNSDLMPPTMNASFAANRASTVVTAVRRRRVVLPGQAAPNTNPSNWQVVIPLDQPVSSFPDRGAILFDLKVFATSNGGATPFPLDAISAPAANAEVSTLYAPSPGATSGTLSLGSGAILGLVNTFVQPRTPTMSATGTPDLGATYTVQLANTPPSAASILFTGFSRTNWSGLPLPVDLAPLGVDYCFVLQSLDIPTNLTSDSNGFAAFNLNIGMNTALVGVEYFHQTAVLDPLANSLGLTFSNGLAVVVGR